MAAKKPTKFEVALVPLGDLAYYERNARTHPQGQIEEIKESMRRFGFTAPVLADMSDGGIIAAGHGRHMALEQLFEASEVIKLPSGGDLPAGMVPVIDCSNWSEEQRRAYTLADNKIALNSGWDEELLKFEIEDLLNLASSDAPLIGFSDEEIKGMIEGVKAPENYSRKVEAPIYRPKGDKPEISALADVSKSKSLSEEIAASRVPADVKAFLQIAAHRHTVFDFQAIAEFYCHATPKVQHLMERSGLVIIDLEKAIENGFVELSDAVSSAWNADHAAEAAE